MTPANICIVCANYLGKGRCKAFPGGIPVEIERGKLDHTQPLPNDNGIRFEPLPQV